MKTISISHYNISQSIKTLGSVYTMSIVVVLFSSLNCYCQSYQHINITKNDGLPTNYVYGAIQDEAGAIYAYTDNGIAKYNGYDWSHLTLKDGLPGVDVHTMIKDKYGVLHGQCYNGNSFRIINDSIIQNPFASLQLSTYREKALYNSSRGLYYLIAEDGSSTELKLSQDISDFYHNQSNLPSGSCIGIYNKTKSSVYYQKGKVFVNKVATRPSSVILNNIDPNYLGQIVYRLNKDKYCISLGNGAIILDKNLDVLDTIRFNGLKLFEEYIILNSYQDKDGGFWIGTKNKGLIYISSNYRQVTIEDITYEDGVQSMLQLDSSRFLFVTDKGEFYYHTDQQSILIKDYGYRIHQLNSLKDETIIITSKQSHEIWDVSNVPIMLDSFLLKTKLKKNLDGSYEESIGRIAKNIDYDGIKKSYYSINSAELYSNDENSIENLLIKVDSFNKTTFQDRTLLSQIFWRTDNQLRFHDLKKGMITHTLPIQGISDVHSSDNETYFISTYNDGLYQWSSLTEELVKVANIENIQLLDYTNNTLYILTEDEVFEYSNGKVLDFIKSKDGLPISNVTNIVYADNAYFLGTDVGLVRFDRNESKSQKEDSCTNTSFDFVIDSIRIVEQSKAFGYDQNDVVFNSILTHYPSQDNIQYKYKLAPIEEDFKTTTSTSLNYVNLQPDEYHFEIYGINSYGKECMIGSQSFTINRAWYNTVWFRLGGLLIIGYYLFYYLRSRQIAQKAELTKEMELKQQMAKIKLSALRSQMNPHFIFNALGSIQYYIQKNEQDLADEYLGQFATLMRMYLDASKEDTILLADELELLQHYMELEQMRFENLFEYEFIIDDSVNQNLFIPTMLFQPIVENAVNHGLRYREDGSGKLDIELKYQNSHLIATITDNGIGIVNSQLRQNQKRKSHSGNILKEKIEILKEQGVYDVKTTYSEVSKNSEFPGTQVVIRINFIADTQYLK